MMTRSRDVEERLAERNRLPVFGVWCRLQELCKLTGNEAGQTVLVVNERACSHTRAATFVREWELRNTG